MSHNLDRVSTQLPDNVEQRYGIDRVEGDDIILTDGSVIHADMIILATGYRYELQSTELFFPVVCSLIIYICKEYLASKIVSLFVGAFAIFILAT